MPFMMIESVNKKSSAFSMHRLERRPFLFLKILDPFTKSKYPTGRERLIRTLLIRSST